MTIHVVCWHCQKNIIVAAPSKAHKGEYTLFGYITSRCFANVWQIWVASVTCPACFDES